MQQKYINIGDSFFDIEQFDQALNYYLKAYELNETIVVLNKIALTYYNMNLYSKALDYYDKSIKLNSEVNIDAIKGISFVYSKIENYPLAIKFTQKAIENSPDDKSLFDLLQQCIKLHKSSKNKVIYTNEIAKYQKRAEFFLAQKDFKKVEDNCKKILKINPENEFARKHITSKKPNNIEDKFEITDIENKSSFNKLHELIGLENIKNEIASLIDIVKINKVRKENGLKTSNITLHSVFYGPPGTGKTTIARLLSEILKDIGILKKGHVIETARNNLVAEYVGQTAQKTNNIIDEAIGGILFIDEAYTLKRDKGNSQDFGQEVIDTLLKRMEDDRNEFIVIVAGYEDEMNVFIDSNPGLKSRFTRYFKFKNYTTEELIELLNLFCIRNDYILDNKLLPSLSEYLFKIMENSVKNFSNGRFIRNMFELMIKYQAKRLSKSAYINENELTIITIEDFNNIINEINI